MTLRIWPLLALILAAACGPAPSAPSGPGDGGDQPKSGGTLRVLHREDPSHLSIYEESTVSIQFPVMHAYNNLVMFDPTKSPESLETIVPELAQKWTVAPDGKAITFELNQGIKWQDGAPFTAKDVKYTFETVKTGTDAMRPDVKMRASPRAAWFSNVEGVETQGDYTALFKLARPQPSLMGMLAASYSPVYPSHVPVSELRVKPVGTGPFSIVEWRKGETISYTKNQSYWRPGRPYLDQLQYVIIVERATQLGAIRTKQLQLGFPSEFTKENAEELKAAVPQLVVEEVVTASNENIVMNTKKAPWSDLRVRLAVTEAIDRQAYLSFRQGAYSLGTNLQGNGPWGYPKDEMTKLPGYGPNIEERRAKAKRLLAEAGFPNGITTEFLTRDIRSYTDLATFVLDQLDRVGIKGTLKPLQTPIYTSTVSRGDYDIAVNLTGLGFDDPDVMFYENFKCGELRNYSQWCDREVDSLADQQSSTVDREKRKQLLNELDRKITEAAPRPILGWRKNFHVWWPEVRGYKPMASTQNAVRFDNLWLAQ